MPKLLSRRKLIRVARVGAELLDLAQVDEFGRARGATSIDHAIVSDLPRERVEAPDLGARRAPPPHVEPHVLADILGILVGACRSLPADIAEQRRLDRAALVLKRSS